MSHGSTSVIEAVDEDESLDIHDIYSSTGHFPGHGVVSQACASNLVNSTQVCELCETEFWKQFVSERNLCSQCQPREEEHRKVSIYEANEHLCLACGSYCNLGGYGCGRRDNLAIKVVIIAERREERLRQQEAQRFFDEVAITGQANCRGWGYRPPTYS